MRAGTRAWGTIIGAVLFAFGALGGVTLLLQIGAGMAALSWVNGRFWSGRPWRF